MHALIIEDESLIAISIEDILAECGFNSFDVACSADQAVAAARLRCPDLITADVQLNPGNGIDAVDQISRVPPIPVVFITGSPAEVMKRMPEHLLITKPFTSEIVAKAVGLALGASKRRPT